MSYFDDASLVMIPSGYKDQKVYSVKPIDGSGDLTFSRASSATRVNSSGLVEKVRENLLLQSNTFSTGWSLANTTIASGQEDRNGSNNAWLLTKSAGGGYIRQTSLTSTVFSTFSVYVKAADSDYVLLLCGSGQSAYFDLVNGTVISGTTASIESAGNGFYRCSIVNNTTATDARIYPAENGSISASTGSVVIMDAQFEQTDFGPTPYIATTSSAVSVGPVSGLPRLDYSGGASCPSLLLEPQRTNIALYSEQFDNAVWTKSNATITANQVVSPDGYTNAEFIVPANGVDGVITQGAFSFTSGTSYTLSVYGKKEDFNFLLLAFPSAAFPTNNRVGLFDLNAGTVASATQSGTGAVITNVGNGWYRCSISIAANATNSGNIVIAARSSNNLTSLGNGTDGIYIWGAQLEAGAYATSYIPTLGAAVTRLADSASKTGISSLIGQTEGTMFVEVNLTSIKPGTFLSISEGTTANRVDFGVSAANLFFIVRISATESASTVQTVSGTVVVGRYKIAVGYKSGNTIFYINGVQSLPQITDTFTFVNALTKLSVGNARNDTAQMGDGVTQAALFPTRLTNAQLAELTAL